MTYVSMLNAAKDNAFNREKLQAAFNRIQESDALFNGLFADVDLYSNRLGTGDQKQSATVAEVIKVLDGADLIHAKGDVLGNAYEYLIGQFASETGKKAGEFYTPHGPAQILCRIAMTGQENKKGLQVYDPCMGSGSLMLSCKNYSSEPDYIKYYGQELMPSTYNLARMNMFLHGVLPENQHLRNGDTLDADWPTDEDTEFDVVTMNPPYSAHWSAAEGFKRKIYGLWRKACTEIKSGLCIPAARILSFEADRNHGNRIAAWRSFQRCSRRGNQGNPAEKRFHLCGYWITVQYVL